MVANLLLPIAIFFLPQLAQAGLDSTQFEIVVVESLPPDIHLSMSLSQLAQSKENSRLEVAKRQIYQVVSDRLSPLLSDPSISEGYDLLQLSQKVPLNQLVNDLANLEITRGAELPPMDFMIMVLPQVANHARADRELPYQALYSKRKASLIDDENAHFQAQRSLAEQINHRFDMAIHELFESRLQTHGDAGFFVGALAGIHLRPEGVRLRMQLLGGLPTDRSLPFEQIEDEAHFREIRGPVTPKRRWLRDRLQSYPGAIVTLSQDEALASPPQLKVSFGSLAELQRTSWAATQRPESLDNLWIGNESVALTSFTEDFNVPHLVGDLLSPTGYLVSDWALARDYRLKLNVFDIEMNLRDLTITKMRIGVELSPKETMWGVLPLPSFELESVNQQFVEAGNAALSPYKEQLETLLNGDIYSITSNPKARALFLKALFDLLQTEQKAQP